MVAENLKLETALNETRIALAEERKAFQARAINHDQTQKSLNALTNSWNEIHAPQGRVGRLEARLKEQAERFRDLNEHLAREKREIINANKQLLKRAEIAERNEISTSRENDRLRSELQVAQTCTDSQYRELERFRKDWTTLHSSFVDGQKWLVKYGKVLGVAKRAIGAVLHSGEGNSPVNSMALQEAFNRIHEILPEVITTPITATEAAIRAERPTCPHHMCQDCVTRLTLAVLEAQRRGVR